MAPTLLDLFILACLVYILFRLSHISKKIKELEDKQNENIS